MSTTIEPTTTSVLTSDHECVSCGATISNRYAFRTCTPCAMRILWSSREIAAWREEQRTKAYERLERAGLVKRRYDE